MKGLPHPLSRLAVAGMALGTPQGEAESTDAGSGLAVVFAEDVAALDGGRAGVREEEDVLASAWKVTS